VNGPAEVGTSPPDPALLEDRFSAVDIPEELA
jgi:hypothetical protein